MVRPITIGHVTLRNRVVMGDIPTRLETRDNPVERMAAFMAARAEGEVGLILTEGHSPTPRGEWIPSHPCSMTPRTSTNTASSGRRPRRRRTDRPSDTPRRTIRESRIMRRSNRRRVRAHRQTRTVTDPKSDEFGLTAEGRAQMIPSGRAKLMDKRVVWSGTHLSQAGLIERPVRAQVKITPAGLEVLRSRSDRVDVSVLRDYPAYREFRERSRAKQPADSSAVEMRDSGEASSPEDLIDSEVAENRAGVEGEILKKALSLSPLVFEDFV